MNIVYKLRSKITERRYYIGFLGLNYMKLQSKERFNYIQWIDLCGYNKGWFADPFILRDDGRIIELLAEEFVYKSRKGRLVNLLISKDKFKLLKVTEVLNLDTHLSFPIYFEENGTYYVYPENYQNGSLTIYEYDSVHKKLINPIVIIHEPLLDTQIIKIGNDYFALGVKYVTGTQLDTKNLFIYRSKSLFGDYTLFQVIENKRCEERGAGSIFEQSGKLIRPAQCCEGDYGKSVILYELKFQNGYFIEKEIDRIEADNSYKYGRGMHTFNKKNDVLVLDGNGYVFWRINKLIRGLLKKDD